jgi:SPP1 gp7 family putative phage head morphogenesis protein
MPKIEELEDIEAVKKNPMTLDLGPGFGDVDITDDLMRKSLDYNAILDFRLRNPDQLLLDNGKNIRLYDEMMLDDAINSTINIKKRMVLSIPNDFRPASESPKDLEICEFVKRDLTSMKLRWIDAIDNMFDATVYGFKVAEKVWGIVGDKVVLKNLKFRHSLLFDFEYDEFANLSVLHIGYYWGGQHIAVTGDDIHKKFLIFVYPYIKDGIYYGQSELKEVFNLWLAKTNIMKWRNMFVQNYGQPIAQIKYDADTAKDSEISQVEDMMAHLQENQYFRNPSMRDPNTGELRPKFEVDFIDVTKGGTQGTQIHEKAIDQLDKMIKRKLLLPDKLGFSETKTGSFNQADTQYDMLMSVILFYCGRLEDTVNKEIIPQLVNYNFPGVTEYPRWEFDRIDNKLRGDMLQILIQNGVVRPDESWIRRYVNIPEDDKQVGPKQDKAIDSIISIQNIAEGSNDTVPTSTVAQGYDTQRAFPQMNVPHQVSPIAGRQEQYGPSSQPVAIGAYAGQDPRSQSWGGKEGQPQQGSPGPIPGGMANTGVSNKVAPTGMWRTYKRKSIHDVYNFDSHRKDLDKNEADFVMEYNKVCGDMAASLVRQIQRKKIIEDKDLKAFNSISIPKGDLKSLLTQYLAKMYLLGKANAIDQNKARIKKARPQAFTRMYFSIDETDDGIDWLDREWIDNYLKEYGDLGTLTAADKSYLKQLRDKAFFLTGSEEAEMLKVFHIIDGGLKDGLMARDIISAIESQLADQRQQYALTIARTNGAEAYNTANMNLYMSDDVRPGIEAFMFAAIMDEVTTEICAAQDGRVIYKDDPELARYTPPLHFNCRSTLIPIFIGENGDEESFFHNYQDNNDEIDHGVRPAEGFGG